MSHARGQPGGYAVRNAAKATQIAMLQAQMAGLPMALASVSSVRLDERGLWEVIVSTSTLQYVALISPKDGSVLAWQKLPEVHYPSY
jgi:hypothetical protein